MFMIFLYFNWNHFELLSEQKFYVRITILLAVKSGVLTDKSKIRFIYVK